MFELERASARRIHAVPMRSAPATRRARPLTPAETAWIVLIPCAAVMLAAIVTLGPPLGRALFKPGPDALWPAGWWATRGQPEPVKHGRYALAALAPLVLAGAILLVSRRPPRLWPWVIRPLALLGQVGALAFVIRAVLGQRDDFEAPLFTIFSSHTLRLAAALAVIAALALRWRRAVAWIARLARERPLTRIACVAIAAAFTATWLVEVVANDGLAEDTGAMNWIPNGAYAVLDGRTPLVDVHLVYAKLLPYPTALVMSAFGATTFVFTIFMAVLNLAALLAVYAVLRRIVGSARALVLYLPFVALSDVGHWMYLASIWPMRYGSAYLLAWLTARHVDGAGPRRAWIVFLVGGLAMLDTFDFGLAALLASAVALLFARLPGSARDVWRLAGAVAGGVLAAVALVAAFTLVRAGAPPRLDVLLEWPRIFTGLGWFALPLPRTGLHLAIYATFAAAVAVAAVRVARAADDVLLTSMLAWSGVFGVFAGNYYVGRPDPVKLLAMFSAWGFALALLTIVCVRGLAARERRVPSPAELLVLFAFALAVCTIGQLRSPKPKIDALANAPRPIYRALAEPLVARHTRSGEKVAILLPESYRIAYDLGLVNVAPYETQTAIVTRRQMRTLIDAVEREGVRELFTNNPGYHVIGDAEAAPEQLQAIGAAGFRRIRSTRGMIEWRRAVRDG